MNKKILIAFLLMFTLVINVDALTIKEDSSSYTSDVYIFGSTKFDNNTIITFNAVGIAGMNEAKINLLLNGKIDTTNVKTYYYSDLTKSWNSMEMDTGKLIPLTKEETIALEENLNIYYVNNNEKTITFTYDGEIDENSLKVNNTSVNSKAKLENNQAYIPVTWLDGFTFTSNNTLVNVKLGEIVKTDENSFIKKYDNPILKVNPTLSLESNDEYNLGEEIKVKVNVNPNSYNNASVKVKTNITKSNGEVIADDITTINLSEDIPEIILGNAEVGAYTIKLEIILNENNIVSFAKTIKVKPKGRLEIYSDNYTINDNIYTITNDLDYKIYYSGCGYLVYLSLYAPKNFTPTNSKVKIDGIEYTNWYDEYEDSYILYTEIEFFEDERTKTIEVEWEEGIIQTFIIKLADNVKLNEKLKGEILSDYGYANEDTLNITSFVGEEETGYTVPVTLKIGSESIYARIYINDVEIFFGEYSSMSNTVENWSKYSFNVKLSNIKDKVKVEAEWGKGYIQTFYVKFDDSIINPNN